MLSFACSDDDGVPSLVLDGGLPGTTEPTPNVPDAAVGRTSDSSESSTRTSGSPSPGSSTDDSSAATDETSTDETATTELSVAPTSNVSTSIDTSEAPTDVLATFATSELSATTDGSTSSVASETTTDDTGTVIVVPDPSSTVDGNTSTDPGNGETITLGIDSDAGADGGNDSGLEDSSVAGDAGADASVDAGPELHLATLAELTDKSEPNYADNEHGLIDGSRLASWLGDWSAQRPAEIDGRLVILQVVPSVAGALVNIPANPAQGVVSYVVAANEFNAPRNNGLSAFETDLPSGPDADAWFKKYAIDPRSDFVLIAFEEQANTTNTIVHSVGRAWLFLKYWGVAKEHLGILNGSVNWNADAHGITLASKVDETFTVPPNDGEFSVKDSGVDATVSVISLEEIIAVLHEEEGADPVSKVRIVDARGGAEALGLRKATSTGRTDCPSYTGALPNSRCSTPFEGRIKGARSVPWAQFLDTKQNGFRFLPYNDVKTAFDAQAEWNEELEWTVQYCRTNQRSTVTGIVASVILGYPTRLYETSFIEWGHASTVPSIVGETFPFRTDLPTLTEHAVLHPDDVSKYTPGGSLGELTQPVTWVAGPNYNASEDVSPVSAEPWPANESGWPKLDANATTSRLAIDEDRAYLRGVAVEDL